MENKNQPAYPIVEGISKNESVSTGLTKRELIAAMAMQGMLTNITYIETKVSTLAESAIQYADALLTNLEGK